MTNPITNKEECNCIMSGYAQTTNYCPIHKGATMLNPITKQLEIIKTVDFILSRPYLDIAMGDQLKASDEMRRLMVLEISKLISNSNLDQLKTIESEVIGEDVSEDGTTWNLARNVMKRNQRQKLQLLRDKIRESK